MISLLFLFFYRITETIGGHRLLPQLENQELKKFIGRPQYSVIVFADNKEDAYFVNYAIARLNESLISFAISPEDQGEQYQCTTFPCVVPFQNGQQITKFIQYPVPTQGSLFYSWCCSLLNPQFHVVKNPYRLENLLNQDNISGIFGVDNIEPPSNLPEDVPFYSVPSQTFREINLTIPSGLYVFHGATRNLNLIKNHENLEESLKTNIISFEKVDFTKKKYVAGYYFPSAESEIRQQDQYMNLLIDISKRKDFSDFYFSPFNDETIIMNKLQFRETPLFIVFEKVPDSRTLRHYTKGGTDKINDIDYLTGFLNGIQTGKLKYEPLSNINIAHQLKDYAQFEISYKEFTQKVNEDRDVLVVCYSTFPSYGVMISVSKLVVEHLNTSNITLVSLNLTCNEVPDEINVIPPGGIFLFSKDKKDQPIPFMFNRYQFFDVLNFIKKYSTITYDITPFNNRDKDHELALIRYGFQHENVE